MKVLHVIPGIGPLFGGPSLAIKQMTSALAANGVHVDVATTTANGGDELDVPLDRPMVENKVRYFFFARQRPKSWIFSWPLTRWLQSHLRTYDIVHVHALFSYASLPACRLAGRFQIPYMIRPLGTLDGWALHHRRWKKAPYYWLFERRNLLRASAIHVTSNLEEREVWRLGLPVPIVMIPLGVEFDALPVRERTRPAPGEIVTILFLGRLHSKKGIELLLEATAWLRNRHALRLIVAGEGEDAYSRSLKARVKESGLESLVTFPGFVQGRQKQELLETADLFVLPSSDENFGLSVAEAMAAGLPVIVSDKVGLAEDIRAARAGLVTECDVASLESALEQLVASSETRNLLGANGARLVREKFQWDPVARELISAYRRLLDHGVKGGNQGNAGDGT